MAKSVYKIAKEILTLPDVAKLRLVDVILSDLDKPDRLDSMYATARDEKIEKTLLQQLRS